MSEFDSHYEFKSHFVEDLPDDIDNELKDYAHVNGKPFFNREFATMLWEKYGVLAETRSIGFSKRNNKWYGWSHRAIYGFTIGDVVSEGDCAAEPGTLPEGLTPENDFSLPVGFEAKTMDDAKRMAIAFADSVS